MRFGWGNVLYSTTRNMLFSCEWWPECGLKVGYNWNNPQPTDTLTSLLLKYTQIVLVDVIFSWLSQRQLQMVYVSYNISISLWFHCPQHFLSDPGQITNASPSSSLFQRGIHPDMEYTWNHPARFLIHFKEGLFGLRLLNLKRGKLCSRQIELMNFIDLTKCSDKAWWWLCCLCSSSKALKR